MGIRIEQKKLKELEKIAQDRNITPNQLAKIAISEWLDINFNIQNHNFIIFEKVFFSRILENVDEELLEKMAGDLAKSFLDFVRFQLELSKEKIELKRFLRYLAKILGKNGLLWLEHFDYEIKKNNYAILRGVHSINQSFAILLTAVISYLMEELFNYVLIEEKLYLSETTIELEYKPKYE